MAWDSCGTCAPSQLNTLKGHQYEGKLNFDRKCAKSDTKPCWNVNLLRWTITQGNQMTFFEQIINLEREKEENQYPKDVQMQ